MPRWPQRPGHRALEHLCRAGRHPLLSAARRAAGQPLLRPGGDRGQGHRGARAAAAATGEAAGRGVPRRSSARVSPLELGPPVGWPVQYRVMGPDPTELRDIAHAARASSWPASRGDAPGQFRLDGAGARAAHPDRPGPGAAAGPELGRRSPTALNATISGHHRHPGARRHLSGQRGGARDRAGSACRSRPCARLPGAAAQRAHHPAQPVRDLRVRPGLPAGLAARPGADPDRPGRRRAGRAAGDRGRRPRRSRSPS